MHPERTFPPTVETIRALRSLQHIARDAGVFIVDVLGPQHDQTFISRAWITTMAGTLHEARAEARRSKEANGLAAAAVLAQLHAAEPDHPTCHRTTFVEREALRAKIAREKAERDGT